MNSGRTHTDASAELSEVSEGSKQSLPGCDNYGYSESGPWYVKNSPMYRTHRQNYSPEVLERQTS